MHLSSFQTKHDDKIHVAIFMAVRGEPDGTTSHPTRLPKDASQVVGYVEP